MDNQTQSYHKDNEILFYFSGNEGGFYKKLTKVRYFLLNRLGPWVRKTNGRGTLKNASKFSGQRIPWKIQDTERKPVCVTINKYNWDNFNTIGPANLLNILDKIKQCLQQDSVYKNAKNGNYMLIYVCLQHWFDRFFDGITSLADNNE